MSEHSENPDVAGAPPVGELQVAGESFVPGDRRARRRVAVGGAAIVVLGLIALGALRAELRRVVRLAQDDVPAAVQQVQRLALWTFGAASFGLVGMAVSLMRLGRRIRRSDRYPPPGMLVLRDTPLRTGAAARRMARSVTAGGVFFLVMGTLGMAFLYWLAARILEG